MYYKHGKTKHPLYSIWHHMKNRCYVINHKEYKNYGARGIIVCENWKDDFNNFYEWCITNGYAKGLQIDRIENNGNYEPSNCKFSTPKENSNNKRNNIRLSFNNKCLSIEEWSKETGVNSSTIRGRLFRKLPIAIILSTTINK